MAHLSTLAVLGGLLALAGAARGQAVSFAYASTWVANYMTTSRPRNVLITDLDGNGLPDILTAGSGSNTVEIMRNGGGGSFLFSSYGARGNPCRDVAVADVDRDGRLDVLLAGADGVSILLGQAGYVYQYASRVSCGTDSAPEALVTADINGDGKADVLTASSGLNEVAVLLGIGNGAFQPAVSYPTGALSRPIDVAVADVNGDGKRDALVANFNAGTVGVLLGNGNGTFQPMVGYPAAAMPGYLAVADVNGDAAPDLLVGHYFNEGVTVLLNNGNGTFQTGTVYGTSSASAGDARGIAVGDLNGDGRPDLASANYDSNTIGVLLGNGDGTFQPATTYYANGNKPNGVGIGDITGDGRPDIAFVNWGSNTFGLLRNTTPLPTRATLPGATATLAPNPAGAAARLGLTGLPASVAAVQATVLDATGREVLRKQVPTKQGAAQAELPTAGLAPGLYVVRLAATDAQGGLVGELPGQRLSVE